MMILDVPEISRRIHERRNTPNSIFTKTITSSLRSVLSACVAFVDHQVTRIRAGWGPR